MKSEALSWVSNGSTPTVLVVFGAILGAYVLIVFAPLVAESLRPSYREAVRKARRPGSIVRCGCPDREPSPLFGEQTYVTGSALETERFVQLLQARGCRRVLVIGPDGAETVAMPAGPVTEYGQGWKGIGR